MQKANLISGISLFVFSVLLILHGIPTQIEDAELATISPRTIPYLTAGVVAFLSAVLVLTSLRRSPRQMETSTVLPLAVLVWTAIILGTVLLCLVVVLHVSPLLGALLMPLVIMVGMGERRPLVLAAVPCALAFSGWLLLYKILGTAVA